MSQSWMVQRLRSLWVSENVRLILLQLLRSSSSLNEWEALDLLYRRFGLILDIKEFQRLIRHLAGQGFIEAEGDKHTFKITGAGVKLLVCLENERESVVSQITGARSPRERERRN